jgi:hypothetical protein
MKARKTLNSLNPIKIAPPVLHIPRHLSCDLDRKSGPSDMFGAGDYLVVNSPRYIMTELN